MSAQYTNTLDGLLNINGKPMADIFPTNVLDDAPVVKAAFAVPASAGGILHSYARQTVAPGAGFRAIGAGLDNAAGKADQIDVACKFLDASFTRDVAAASGYAKGIAAYMQRETGLSVRAAFAGLEKALFQTVSGGLTGFNAFADYAVDVSGGQVINKGGTTGQSRSVWLIRWAEDGAAVVAGNDGTMNMIWDDDNPTIVRVHDGASASYNAYAVTLGGWFGLQVGSTYDVARICGLDGASGKTLNDDVLAEAIAKFRASNPANMIVMNRTSLKELREARTATNPTGAPAPFPTEAFGIPIVVTDLLSSTEATA